MYDREAENGKRYRSGFRLTIVSSLTLFASYLRTTMARGAAASLGVSMATVTTHSIVDHPRTVHGYLFLFVKSNSADVSMIIKCNLKDKPLMRRVVEQFTMTMH